MRTVEPIPTATSKVASRLTGRAWTGALAAALWVSNAALAEPMVWISAYNQVLFVFWLLLAFLFKSKHLYLAPGADRGITPIRDTFGTVADHMMPAGEALQRLEAGTCAAFDLRQTPPRDISSETLEKLRMQ